jgi:glycosyltransferase involved in cell wall biosynthesis
VNLCKGLTDNFESKLICGQISENEVDGTYLLEDEGVEVFPIKNMKRSINPFQDLFAFLEIRKIIKEYKPDIVETHAAKPGTLGRLAALSCGVKTIIHTFHGNAFQGYFSPFITKIFIGIERFLANKSSAIVSISELQRKELVEKFKISKADKTFVVPLGLQLDKFKAKNEEDVPFKSKSDIIYITIIGRLTAIKNHKLFIDVIKELKSQCNSTICGVIVGEGELTDELIAYSKESDLIVSTKEEDNCDLLFTGAQKNINGILHNSDIVALTSNNEGTPVTLLEAQAAGKPIISTNVGGIQDVTTPSSTLLSESGNSEEMVSNALEMMSRLGIYTKNAIENADSVIDRFSVANLVKNIEELYLELHSKNNP